ncbi:CPBP family intramembrane metalloprotease [Campylobacter sp. FMV-PI01]|uniref:CPBP family intramembrane metalloprotease n=1 Tax=Campylobacter portucalensis TaxID=2608384 RepID=A0A6L5WKM0_9BACT|nr:CPBP family glutamic-type intramembrane protease [Campylobacter portucalensis]MSN96291.1 CPBP family intramembrane metalloprotease [Campylobacter portucalensis]
MQKLQVLKWFDVVIISMIMFSFFIYSSAIGYFGLKTGAVSLNDNLDFSSSQNYLTILTEIFFLMITFLYLKFRNFDFLVLFEKIKFNIKSVFLGILLFIILAFLMDLCSILMIGFYENLDDVDTDILINFDSSIILFSIVNGFYEEIFFLGICLLVDKKFLPYALFYGLLIRFSFHTYQGMITALEIGFFFGAFVYIFHKYIKNLVPFFIAHAIGDMIGISTSYFWQFLSIFD